MDQPPPISEPQPATPPPRMSLLARLLNVFAIPGDVFEEVKSSPFSTANWLAPALLFAIVGAASAVIVFSQPAIQQRFHEEQTRQLDQQVKAGRMTQTQADSLEQFFEPATLKIVGGVGAVIASFARIFWWALVVWLLGLVFLKTKFSYLKAVEIAGLTTMITVLGAIVTLLLMVNFGKLAATPSLALAVEDFDRKNKTHLLMGAANVFYFWQIGVLSAGLARLAQVPFLRALVLVAGYWLLAELFLISSGLGNFAL